MGERNMQTYDDEEAIEIPPTATISSFDERLFHFGSEREKLAECSRLNI